MTFVKATAAVPQEEGALAAVMGDDEGAAERGGAAEAPTTVQKDEHEHTGKRSENAQAADADTEAGAGANAADVDAPPSADVATAGGQAPAAKKPKRAPIEEAPKPLTKELPEVSGRGNPK